MESEYCVLPSKMFLVTLLPIEKAQDDTSRLDDSVSVAKHCDVLLT